MPRLQIYSNWLLANSCSCTISVREKPFSPLQLYGEVTIYLSKLFRKLLRVEILACQPIMCLPLSLSWPWRSLINHKELIPCQSFQRTEKLTQIWISFWEVTMHHTVRGFTVCSLALEISCLRGGCVAQVIVEIHGPSLPCHHKEKRLSTCTAFLTTVMLPR